MRLVDKLKSFFESETSVLFCSVCGSVGKERETANSDSDVAIAGQEALSSDCLAGLNVRLSDRMGRDADVIDLRAKSGVILQEVLRSGKVLINKSPDIYAYLIRKMWHNQEDMMPNTRMIWKRHQKLFEQQLSL